MALQKVGPFASYWKPTIISKRLEEKKVNITLALYSEPDDDGNRIPLPVNPKVKSLFVVRVEASEYDDSKMSDWSDKDKAYHFAKNDPSEFFKEAIDILEPGQTIKTL